MGPGNSKGRKKVLRMCCTAKGALYAAPIGVVGAACPICFATCVLQGIVSPRNAPQDCLLGLGIKLATLVHRPRGMHESSN